MTQRRHQSGQLGQALQRETMRQRSRRTVGPIHRQRHPIGRTSLTDQHPLRAGPGLLEEDRQPLTRQRVEWVSDDNRVRNRARFGRTGSMRGPSGSTADASRSNRVWGSTPGGPAAAGSDARRGPSPVRRRPGHPVLLDVGEGLSVDARRTSVPAHLYPRTPQHVPAMDLVVERMEPSSGVGLGRPVERSLQGLDLVLLGGTSHEGTHQPFPAPKRTDEVAALPSPAVVLSARLNQYYDRLRRPPGSMPTSR